MRNNIEDYAVSLVIRSLESEQELTVDEAIERAEQFILGFDLFPSIPDTVKKTLNHLRSEIQHRGVINPNWLFKKHNLYSHFFLVNSQPGWLHHLVKQTKSLEAEISNFILYGEWDSLLVLNGTEQEANDLLETMQSTTYHDLTHFSSKSVARFYRYNLEKSIGEEENHSLETINKIAENFDVGVKKADKESLIKSNIILGPTWRFNSRTYPPITAFVGITLRGGSHHVKIQEVLNTLLKYESLKTCLVHLFEVDRGNPFHYFAKLDCIDLKELDKATDAISFSKVGSIALEGNTFIVSSGTDRFPKVRTTSLVTSGVTINLRKIDEIASEVVTDFGIEATIAFNKLDGTSQLIILQSLGELYGQINRRYWDEEREACLRSVINNFIRASLEGPEGVRMSAPVLEMVAGVEGYCKYVFRKMTEAVHGTDYSHSQKELKLSNRDYRKLTMGNLVSALRAMKVHKDFKFATQALEDDWINRLDLFTSERNKWIHGGVSTTLSGERVIDDSRRIIIEGIELIRWFGKELLGSIKKLSFEIREESIIESLPEKKEIRGTGVFISYSTKDEATAQRIAAGLKAFKLDVWYAEWAISVGDSIVQKISEALLQNDILIVLLSPDSVKSKWVQKELNSALMRQLSDQKVKIIPVLIAKCNTPTIIKELRYIDLAKDYQAGFIELLQTLRDILK